MCRRWPLNNPGSNRLLSKRTWRELGALLVSQTGCSVMKVHTSGRQHGRVPVHGTCDLVGEYAFYPSLTVE